MEEIVIIAVKLFIPLALGIFIGFKVSENDKLEEDQRWELDEENAIKLWNSPGSGPEAERLRDALTVYFLQRLPKPTETFPCSKS